MTNGDCECLHFSSVTKDLTKDELGPAYHDWKTGKVSLDRIWKPFEKIEEPFLDSCCQHIDHDITSYQYDNHIVLLAVWWISVATVVTLWWRMRNFQPLRFRSVEEAFTHLFILSLLFTTQMVTASMGFTASCALQLFTLEILIPCVLVFYVIKPAQFIFIWLWSQAKKGQGVASLQAFYQYKWILDKKIYFIAVLIVSAIGAILTGANYTQPQFMGTDVMYSSLRCYWWEIPDQYTVPKNPTDPRCQCIYGGNVPPTDPYYGVYQRNCLVATSGAPLGPEAVCSSPSGTEYEEFCAKCGLLENDPTDCSTCLLRVQTDPECQQCVGGVTSACTNCTMNLNAYPDCVSCFAVLTSKPCENYLQHYYVHGNQSCGYFKEVPSSGNCNFCIGSDHATVAAWAAFICSFLAIKLYLGYLMVSQNMQDQLLLQKELIFTSCWNWILILISVVGLLSADANDSLRKSSPAYFYLYLNLTIWLWGVLAVSFVGPVAVCYYHWYVHEKNKEELVSSTEEDKPGKTSSQVESEFEQEDAEMAKRATGLYKTYQRQIKFAIVNPDCRELYTKFAAQEFTVENIKFLVAVHDFRMKYNNAGITDTMAEAKDIYGTYIKPGAPIEVNVPDNIRRNIAIALGEQAEDTRRRRQGGASRRNVTEEEMKVTLDSSIAIIRLFTPAYEEILELVAKDSWSRFTTTQYHKDFMARFNSESTLERKLHRVVDSDYNPGSKASTGGNDRRKPASSAQQLRSEDNADL